MNWIRCYPVLIGAPTFATPHVDDIQLVGLRRSLASYINKKGTLNHEKNSHSSFVDDIDVDDIDVASRGISAEILWIRDGIAEGNGSRDLGLGGTG